ncbi:4-hydroxybenzoate 3-monooxygenase [Rhodococcus rhodnii]|uniref:4-hydroxybenzoate 3-monooxygenase n=2 Tax=Rhodococcus rhodnii TaxID=38312 RepID=R7WK03_9NOCA|nr:4-hydroxybenzoate 3-monooxygenase [Rhodococcus rhodnii]EOM75637.1 4-hydroxybenzoate 3-monooxygenase [Rhodococcus rhodnii LMG 5362]TXG91847.1 4-hydroxybenzoate 3-monooxygenase [Rhodococcus rhodnii]
MRTQVAIVGAGPAGLVLARMLELQGIDSVVLESRSREYVEKRTRAGILEQPTVDVVHELGIGDRLAAEGMAHDGFHLRFDRTTHRFDFHSLVGGHATVYPQQKLVADLIAARVSSGLPILFGAFVKGIDTATGRVTYERDGHVHELDADIVAGCDGFHGVARTAIPTALRRDRSRSYPFSWLGILANSTPVSDEGMYCAHENGLSVHSMRGPAVTRQYLQVPEGTDLADWPDDRIWDELAVRSESHDGAPLDRGEIVDRSLAPLRSFVSETMSHERLFLLGDAAHIVPPTGAKGLNLAVSDAAVLSHALGRWFATGARDALDAYAATCLPRIWAAQLFSWTLTTTLHRMSDDPLDARLRFARLRRWVESEAERTALGEVYLGLPFPSRWSHRWNH